MKGIEPGPVRATNAVIPIPARTYPARHVLVVEDDAALRLLTMRTLEPAGFAVDAAEDGAAGWQAVQMRRYDLLITDHLMPHVTGLELVARLRAARMHLPVILTTATMPTEELARQPWLAFAATLQKPIAGEALLEVVEKVLGERKRPSGLAEMPPLPLRR